MFKKFPWFTVLATLVAWMLFWEVKETITGERTFFIYRWLYSDLAHAKDIEVKTYLLTDEQVSYVFAHPNQEIQQPRKPALSSKKINMIIRLRNFNDGVAKGRLRYKNGESVVDAVEVPQSRKGKKYTDIVVPMGVVVIEREDTLPDPITLEWEELYVYPK